MSPSQINTPANSLFLDANVLLEIVLGRKKDLSARKLIQDHSEKHFYIDINRSYACPFWTSNC